jgi:hypothetical protein
MSESKLVPIQFGTQLAEHESGPLTQELAENLYLEVAPKGSKFKYTLLSTPGMELFGTPQSTGPTRGLLGWDNHIFAVIGNTLYRVASDASNTSLGTVEGSGAVSMAHNGTYGWIAVAGGKLYAFDATTLIDLSADLDNILAVTAQDGYILAAQNNSQSWHLSGLDALGNTVPGTNTSADSLPGNLVSIISDHREVLVLKEDSVEVYYNSGNADFPFARTQVVERGCRAPSSVAKDQNRVYWLGEDLKVYAMAGYQPEAISTAAVSDLIESSSSPETATGWTYQQGGHSFYMLSFVDYTFGYDIDTGLWHRRKSKNSERWRVSAHVYMPRWGQHIVGDYNTGSLFELSTSVYDEDGDDLIRTAVGPPIWNNGRRFIVDEFLLDVEAGVGIQRGREDAWDQNTSYSVGDLVSSNSNVYRCSQAGISTASPIVAVGGNTVAAAELVSISNNSTGWTTQTAGHNKIFNSVAYSESLSLFCAVGIASGPPNDQVWTSPDGETWTVRTTPQSSTLRSVVWSSTLSRFVAVGGDALGNTYFVYSADGITWTEGSVDSQVSIILYGVCWSSSQSLFVAVGDLILGFLPYVAYSSDGISWTSGTAAALGANTLYCVTWAEALGLFVAGGGSGTIGTSTDGVTWTLRSPPAATTNSILGVAWSSTEAVLVMVGGATAPQASYVISSTNGTSWTLRTSPTALQLRGVVWSPYTDNFIAVGGEANTQPTVITSPFGQVWTERLNGTLNAPTDALTAVTYASDAQTSPLIGEDEGIIDGTAVWDFRWAEDWGEDPEAILDWSQDGGATWSSRLTRSIGRIGERHIRARWHRLGMHYNWTPRIIISEPVPVRINGAYVRVDMLET